MNAKIELVTRVGLPAKLSIIDNCVYVDCFIRVLLVSLGLGDKIIGNEACLTEEDCQILIALFVK